MICIETNSAQHLLDAFGPGVVSDWLSTSNETTLEDHICTVRWQNCHPELTEVQVVKTSTRDQPSD